MKKTVETNPKMQKTGSEVAENSGSRDATGLKPGHPTTVRSLNMQKIVGPNWEKLLSECSEMSPDAIQDTVERALSTGLTVSNANGGVLGVCFSTSSCSGEDCDLCPWLNLELPPADRAQKIAPAIVKWTVKKSEPRKYGLVKSARESAGVFAAAGRKS